ncbi:MAG: hypothetical protein HY735_03535 [Verrucomicrobia bacterium]|nr:hypothetical protein [Verrucomicrobiota bacterium]
MKFSESNDPTLSVIQSDLLMNLVAVFLLLIGSQASPQLPVGAGSTGRDGERKVDLSLYVSESRVRIGSRESVPVNEQEFARWLARYGATNSASGLGVLIHHTEKEPAGSLFRLLAQLQRGLREPKTHLAIIPE